MKLGAIQFLIFRPVLLVLSMILWVEDKYEYVDDITGQMRVSVSFDSY